jgi:hypothetical protein
MDGALLLGHVFTDALSKCDRYQKIGSVALCVIEAEGNVVEWENLSPFG